eukprot:ANDGO_07517.mRNA.1 Uncharacterized protein C24B11.05
MTDRSLILFFDCDDTLYPESSGVRDKVRLQIESYLSQRFSLSTEKACEYRDRLFKTYGTTLNGLMRESNEIDIHAYWAHIHHGCQELVHPNPELRNALQKLPFPKYVFSNADYNHVIRMITKVGIQDLFEEPVIEVQRMKLANKPDDEAFVTAFEAAKIEDASRTIFFEDALRNLKAAKKWGMQTVFIDEHDLFSADEALQSIPFVDYKARNAVDAIRGLFAHLFDYADKGSFMENPYAKNYDAPEKSKFVSTGSLAALETRIEGEVRTDSASQ